MAAKDFNSSRRFERAHDVLIVQFRVLDFSKDLGEFDDVMTASTLDISAGGMQLRTMERFEPKTLLDLKFKLRPDGKEIVVLSVVTRTEPAEYKGMFYTAVDYPLLSDADRAEIDQHVKEFNSRRAQ